MTLWGQRPRLGLGCMRLSTLKERDEARSRAVLEAAWQGGVRLFDTARAYCLDETEAGHNERLLAAVLGARDAFIITKGGILRTGGRWIPDGRASTIRTHAEESAKSLGRPADLFLLHAPDTKTSWSTSVRALEGVHRGGLAKAVGLSNVSLRQLDEALELAPIAAVQNAWSPFDDRSVTSGVMARCFERGVAFMAHTPLGGPKRARRLDVGPVLRSMVQLNEQVCVIPGASRLETLGPLLEALQVTPSQEERARVVSQWPSLRGPVSVAPAASTTKGEVVLVMGLQGAGKSALVSEWTSRGYRRFNRDTEGKTLAALAKKVDEALSAGETRVVLDNTYTTRTSRAPILEVAARHGVAVHGVWLDVPLHEAQVNVVWRMLEAHGRLLGPGELGKGDDNTTLNPLAQLRLVRELEPPQRSEGFTTLETRPFMRVPRAGAVTPGRFIAASALRDSTVLDARPTLVFDWLPGASEETVAALQARLPGASVAVCRHDAGPPVCWCRPPLPGLLLAFARERGIDFARSTLEGTTETHQVLAGVLGTAFLGT